MKPICTLMILFAFISFSFSQSVREERRVVDEKQSFEIYLKYSLSDSEKAAAVADITNILGESVGNGNWVTAKENDKSVIVKIINGYVFVRGHDYTESQVLRPKLIALDAQLKKYSDSKE